MFAAIAAIALLQAIVVLAVFSLLIERLARNFYAKRSEARLKDYERHILGLLVDPTDIGRLQQAVDAGDRTFVREKLLQQSEQLKGIDKEHMTDVFLRLGFVEQEIGALKSRGWWRRLEAAVNLGNMASQDAVRPLIDAAKDVNEDVRLAAVTSLGRLGTAEGLGVLLDALEDGDQWTPAKILEILVSMGPKIESEILRRLAGGQSPMSRKLYVELCGHLRILAGVELLQALADDTDLRVRTAVAQALGIIGHDSAVGTLNGLLADKECLVRAEAARALGGLGSVETVEYLQQALDDPDWQVRRNAAVSLCRLGPAGKDRLQAAFESGTAQAQRTVAHVIELDRLGIPVIG
ncbi:MAG: HEAT repeat domain-containing protein [Chloroflexi bacterium]|nr:HEAT repeat domain-containing protein [Chloroflexota bacterium]